MAIENMTLPYPDFKYSEVINSEEFDSNNDTIKNKVNEIVPVVNSLDSYAVIAKGLAGYGLQSYLSGSRTVSGGAITTIDVVWLEQFTAIPVVTNGLYAPSSGKDMVVSITNVTAKGCTIRLENSGTVTRTVSGSLIAFGKMK